MIYFMDNCTHAIRTLPTLQHDTHRPEDVDTEGEDHAADEWRYACMSRPWIPKQTEPKPAKFDWKLENGTIRSGLSMREIIDRQAKKRRR